MILKDLKSTLTIDAICGLTPMLKVGIFFIFRRLVIKDETGNHRNHDWYISCNPSKIGRCPHRLC
jgi:hypothetical protein